MDEKQLEKLRYPIGKFSFNLAADETEGKRWISGIEKLPAEIRKSVNGLNQEQLSTTYRDGGWTVKQVVHHLADSHINAYIRIKLALTENNPTIKPYEEAEWAKLDDAKNLPVEISLSLLDALHTRWVFMLRKLSADDFNKTIYHPESKKEMSVKYLVAMYAWHGSHHTAHITELRKREGWS